MYPQEVRNKKPLLYFIFYCHSRFKFHCIKYWGNFEECITFHSYYLFYTAVMQKLTRVELKKIMHARIKAMQNNSK